MACRPYRNIRAGSGCNDFSIGIELEGTDSIPYTDAQYESLAVLVTALLSTYHTLSAERITGHSDIAPGRKSDPGRRSNGRDSGICSRSIDRRRRKSNEEDWFGADCGRPLHLGASRPGGAAQWVREPTTSCSTGAATTVPADKVEVMEIFSYACPFCAKFEPIIDQIERGLPPYAQIVFLPASFIPTEDWPDVSAGVLRGSIPGDRGPHASGHVRRCVEDGQLATVDQRRMN